MLRRSGRRIVEDGPDLLFYTNPIRVVTEDQSLLDKAWQAIAGWVTWKKVWGAGLVVLLASAMWVGISKYLDSREDLPADPKPLPMIPPGTPPKRRHVFVAAMGFLILAMYGSLVPLNPRPGTFDQAWEYFWHFQPWERPDFSNRSDWGANVLLFIPISFCWLGVVCLDKKGFLFKGISYCYLSSRSVWPQAWGLSLPSFGSRPACLRTMMSMPRWWAH